jgi:predicted phage-related endonuclease
MLTGDEFGYFAVLIGGNDFKYFQMERDNELISKIEEAAVLFWNNHILTGIPPEPTGLDHDILNSKYSTPSDNFALLDSDFDVLCEEYLSASKAESHFKNIKNDISAKLKELIGNDIGGKAVLYQAKWSRFEKKTIDTDTMRLEIPEIADIYTKTTKSGCIRVSKVK